LKSRETKVEKTYKKDCTAAKDEQTEENQGYRHYG